MTNATKTPGDRELLEMAAHAHGGIAYEDIGLSGLFFDLPGEEPKKYWNPLTDDGDALRLAVKLDLCVTPYPIYIKPKHSVLVQFKNMYDSRFEVMELHGSDPCAATRRAITRAAAAIGAAK